MRDTRPKPRSLPKWDAIKDVDIISYLTLSELRTLPCSFNILKLFYSGHSDYD